MIGNKAHLLHCIQWYAIHHPVIYSATLPITNTVYIHTSTPTCQHIHCTHTSRLHALLKLLHIIWEDFNRLTVDVFLELNTRGQQWQTTKRYLKINTQLVPLSPTHSFLILAKVCFSFTPCVNNIGTTLISSPCRIPSSGSWARSSRGIKNCIVRESLWNVGYIKWYVQWKLVRFYLVPKIWKSNITSSSSTSLLNSAIYKNKTRYFRAFFQGCFRSVVVITCASHAQGPRFDPGRKQVFFFFFPRLFPHLKRHWRQFWDNNVHIFKHTTLIPWNYNKNNYYTLPFTHYNVTELTNWTEKALKLCQKTYHSYLTQELCILKVLAQHHIKCRCQSGQLQDIIIAKAMIMLPPATLTLGQSDQGRR